MTKTLEQNADVSPAEPIVEPVAESAANDAASTAATPTVTEAHAEGSVEDKNLDWEGRFKGLQPKYQTLQETYKAEKSAWEKQRLEQLGRIGELEGNVKSAHEAVDGLTKDLEGAVTGQTNLEAEIEKLTKQIERHNLIMSEYPDLAILEGKGLLPADKSGDELKAALLEMRTIMGANAQAALANLSAGATGDDENITGRRSQGTDLQSIQEQLMTANKAGDAAEITRLTNLLVEEQEKIYVAQRGGAQ